MPKFSIEALRPDIKTRSRHRLSNVSQNFAIKLAAENDSEKLCRRFHGHSLIDFERGKPLDEEFSHYGLCLLQSSFIYNQSWFQLVKQSYFFSTAYGAQSVAGQTSRDGFRDLMAPPCSSFSQYTTLPKISTVCASKDVS